MTVCPNGDAYLTMDGLDQVFRVTFPDGEAEPYADVQGVQPAGIACDDRGRLFIAGFTLRPQSTLQAPGLLMVDHAGAEAQPLPQPRGSQLFTPNGVAFVPGCGIYTTDTLGGQLVRTFEGTTGEFNSSVEASGLLGINGIAFDPASKKIYLSNSLTQEVVSYTIDDTCRLSRRFVRMWSGFTFGAFLDGLAVDDQGAVYVASYNHGQVLRLPDGQPVASGITHPASLAFRGDTLLLTDYHLNQPTLEGGLYSAQLDRCGVDLFVRER